jgi:1-aminocyclopropane-1-carboxylate deaminase/D-cysteine desulfhydrase-like pyridoxal-dependent ACC family enzyme
LRTFETIVDLIGNTRTEAGLRVKAKLDTRKYSIGVEVTKAEMQKLSLRPHSFHGEWNYELQPRNLTR